MQRKGILAVVGVLVVLLSLVGCFGPAAEAPLEEEAPPEEAPPAEELAPIKIGYLADLSGPYSPVGEKSVMGASLAVKKINEAGGVLGREVELVIRDTKFMLEADPTPGHCEEFVTKEQVLYVSGGYSDAQAETAKANLVYRGTPYLSIVSANPVDNRGEKIHPYKLTGWFNTDARSFCVFPYLLVNNLVHDEFVTIGPDYVWGWNNAAACRNAVEQYGGEVIKSILTPLPTLKFDSYVAQIEELAPPGGCTIVVDNSAMEAVAFFKAAHEARLQDKGFDLMWSVADASTFHFVFQPEELAGVYGWPEWYYGNPPDPTLTEYVTSYYNEYGELPTGVSTYYYLVNYFALTTINEVGDLDPDVWLEAMKGVNIENIIDDTEKSFSTVNGDYVREAFLYRFKQPEDMTVDLFPELTEVGPEWDHLEVTYRFPLEYVEDIVPDEVLTTGGEVGDPRVGAPIRAYWEQYCEENGLEMPPNLRK